MQWMQLIFSKKEMPFCMTKQHFKFLFEDHCSVEDVGAVEEQDILIVKCDIIRKYT